MPQSERFDATVIGGGPAGTSAAIILAKAGKRVVLFERSPSRAFISANLYCPLAGKSGDASV